MNNFTTIFLFTDIGKFQNLIIFWGTILYVIIFGFLWIKFVINIKASKNKFSDSTIKYIIQSVFGLIFAMIVLPMFVSLAFGTYYYIVFHDEYLETQAKYNTQQYLVTEGIVHVLHAQNPLGHDQGDIIKVGDVEFEINAYVGGWNYNKTISHGGALTEGTYARIFYIENPVGNVFKYLILRIDIRE
ncbi:MAG: hypothetical protein KJZ72_13935 [Anaerolineales bacterium]|nr:hypothetical protein [Anaerolineales bacterium]